MRLVLGFLLTFCPLLVHAEGLSDLDGRYRVEPGSVIRFSVGQMGGSAIEGRFVTFSGEFELGGEDASQSHVTFSLKPGSVQAADPRVEAFIKSPAVFAVEQYPTVSFRSAKVTRTGEKTARIEGRLSAKGVTRSTTFQVEFRGRDGKLLKFHVTGKMSRALFNMDIGTPIYSNMVVLDMDLIGKRM